MNRKKNKALSWEWVGWGAGKVVCLTSQSHVSNKMSTKQLSYLFGPPPPPIPPRAAGRLILAAHRIRRRRSVCWVFKNPLAVIRLNPRVTLSVGRLKCWVHCNARRETSFGQAGVTSAQGEIYAEELWEFQPNGNAFVVSRIIFCQWKKGSGFAQLTRAGRSIRMCSHWYPCGLLLNDFLVARQPD